MPTFSLTSRQKFSCRSKKKDRERSSLSYRVDISEDLTIEILSRLPLKSLVRFKCVSKQWQCLISNTIILKSRPKLLTCSNFLGNSLFHSLDHETRVESMHLLRDKKVKVHSSCFGLLLIQVNSQLFSHQKEKRELFVWNPLTRFFKRVLTFRSPCRKLIMADLCFHYENDEYKIVLFEEYSLGDISCNVVHCGTGECKKIGVSDWVCYPHHGPFFKGYKHWICKSRYKGPNHIAYFHPSKNRIGKLPMPKPKNGVLDTTVDLGVLDGCLYMTRLEDPQNYEGNVEFLVMKEFRYGITWDIMFVVSNNRGLPQYLGTKPLFVTEDDEILVCIQINHNDRIVRAYDFYGNFLRDVIVPGFGKCFSTVILYDETWFSPLASCFEHFPPKSWECEVWKYFDTEVKFVNAGERYFYWEQDMYLRKLEKEYLAEEYGWEEDLDFEDEFPSRKKNRYKNKSDYMRMRMTNLELYKRASWCISSAIKTRKKRFKKNKRNYEPKYEDSRQVPYL